MNEFTYKVYENDGGNIILLVFTGNNDTLVYAHDGYDISGQLEMDIKALMDGGDPHSWDGNLLDDIPAADIINSVFYNPYTKPICDNGEIYPLNMGCNGMLNLVDMHPVTIKYHGTEETFDSPDALFDWFDDNAPLPYGSQIDSDIVKVGPYTMTGVRDIIQAINMLCR